jgi:hypothetical protein
VQLAMSEAAVHPSIKQQQREGFSGILKVNFLETP